MLIGYVRVSKSDGTQTLAPQRDALIAAGVDPARIYADLASGRQSRSGKSWYVISSSQRVCGA